MFVRMRMGRFGRLFGSDGGNPKTETRMANQISVPARCVGLPTVISSGIVYPAPPVPSPVGQPDCTMKSGMTL